MLSVPSGPELETEMRKTFLPEDQWQDIDIEGDWLNPLDPFERAKNSLYIGNAPVCSLGGLTVLTGQSGNGKSMTTAMMMGAMLKGEYGQFRRGDDIQSPKVLYIDTEMEKYNTQRQMRRVYYMNGWDFNSVKDNFKILRLRDTVKVADRLKKIWKAIDTFKPTYCVVDGLIDLVEDINDSKETQELVRKLMACADFYDMSLIGVLHQNPGGVKMAGHIGSFAERKAICVLATKKDKNGNDIVFVVEQQKARDKDAESIKFRVNDDNLHIGIPEPISADAPQVEEEIDKLAFCKNVIPKNGISTRDLRKAIEKEFKIGHSKADKILWSLEDEKFVIRDANKRYFLNDEVEQLTIPQDTAPF